MFIDLKYHLTSLVAVFLALAVGIMVGSSFIAGSSMERQITKGLEKEFGKLRAENQKQQSSLQNMQTILERHNKFEAEVVPMLVAKRLIPYRIAIIQTGDYNTATQQVKSILETSGAQISSITTLTDVYAENGKDDLGEVISSITKDISVPNPRDRVLQMIANCIVSGSNAHAMEVFASKGLIGISGDYQMKSFRVVLIGGSKGDDVNRGDDIDLALIGRLRSAGALTIVGSEPLSAESSYIPAYQSQGIPTVDNVDEPMGQVALVFALAGDTGDFGVKKSADRVAPSYLEKELWRNEYR